MPHGIPRYVHSPIWCRREHSRFCVLSHSYISCLLCSFSVLLSRRYSTVDAVALAQTWPFIRVFVCVCLSANHIIPQRHTDHPVLNVNAHHIPCTSNAMQPTPIQFSYEHFCLTNYTKCHIKLSSIFSPFAMVLCARLQLMFVHENFFPLFYATP